MTRSTLPAWNLGHTTGPLRWARFADADDTPADGADTSDKDEDSGDEDPQGDESDDGSDEDGEEPEGSDKLGDAGKRALDSMKAKWKAERKARQDLQAKLDAASNKDDDGAAQATRDALAKANTRIIRSEVRAAAAGKLTDPKDALRFLDLDQFEVDEDGAVDEDEIADAITDLLTKKPYLAAQGERRFKGSADGGPRKESRPKQVTRSDLDRMSPQEINKAIDEGRLFDLLKSK